MIIVDLAFRTIRPRQRRAQYTFQLPRPLGSMLE